MMNKASKEELELLRLQSQGLRLKLLMAQASHRKPSNFDDALDFLDNIPGTTDLALKAVSMPQKFSTKVLVGAALLAIAYIRYRANNKTNR